MLLLFILRIYLKDHLSQPPHIHSGVFKGGINKFSLSLHHPLDHFLFFLNYFLPIILSNPRFFYNSILTAFQSNPIPNSSFNQKRVRIEMRPSKWVFHLSRPTSLKYPDDDSFLFTSNFLM